MRYGFTTGSCAAAAAKAAAYMLLTGRLRETIRIMTPKGIVFDAKLQDIVREEKQVSCAVEKDGGDDPDITTGALVYASVSFQQISGERQIEIDGGPGVGRITRPGMDQPVGSAAINHVPREMIEREVLEVCAAADYKGGLKVMISIPDGVKLAEKTFNPRLGIVGGISVLGTSGVVEPMSSQALLDTIRLELKMKRAGGWKITAVSPGNYGLDFMKTAYSYDLDASIKCSNFIGASLDMAGELGFQRLLLTGHIGKLVKVAGGIMNTHSHEGDCRMELMAAAGLRAGVKPEVLKKILDCATTTEAIGFLEKENMTGPVMELLMERIQYYLNRRAADSMQVACIMYDNQYGELAKSEHAEEFLEELKQTAAKKNAAD